MKVLYIAHTPNEGGSTVALINLIKGIIAKGIEPAVVCPYNGILVDQLKAMNVKVYVPNSSDKYVGYNIYPITKNPIRWVKSMIGDSIRTYKGERYIASVIREFRPDIVHTNSTACVAGFNVCKRMGIKHVWHVREFLDLGFGWTPRPSVSAHVNRLHSPHTYNIVITKAIYNHFKLAEPHEYIYDGALDTKKSIIPQSELNVPYFLFVGALTEKKGLCTAVRQFLEFHKSNKTHHLVIIGSTKRPELNEQLKSEISDNGADRYVHWLGQRNDVYNWMAGATALLVPSFNEGFGFITVEGMFCKTVVIGRDSAGTKEQFDKGLEDIGNEIGLRFKEDSELPNLMAKAINREYTQMKQMAYDVVCKNYTIEANAEKVFNFYNKIIKL